MPTNKPDDLIHQIALKLANLAFDCFDNQKRLEILKLQIAQIGELVKLHPAYLRILIKKIDRANELADEAISDLENFFAEILVKGGSNETV